MSDKISKLTKEQEAMIPVYLERYRAIGLSTDPTDRTKAEESVKAAYKYLKQAEPTILWADSPFEGARLAAELALDTVTPPLEVQKRAQTLHKATKQQVSDQAAKASYGSFEAYWVSFYAFIGEQLPVKKDALLDIVKAIVTDCGVYWTFDDCVVLTPKPTKIVMNDGKLSSVDGRALEYPNGSGIFALDGVRYGTLVELKLASLMKNAG